MNGLVQRHSLFFGFATGGLGPGAPGFARGGLWNNTGPGAPGLLAHATRESRRDKTLDALRRKTGDPYKILQKTAWINQKLPA